MKTLCKVCCCLFAAVAAFGAFCGTTINVGSDEAYKTITDAMTYVGTLGEEAFPVEIRVAKGKYTETGFTLDKAIAIVGDTGNPADVELVDNVSGKRVFTITHPEAVVRDLMVLGTGFKTSYFNGTASYGGHVHMTAGTVENCIITGGNAAAGGSGGWGRGLGGNVYMTGGRLVRCQILNGISVGFKQSSDVENRRSYGAGVYAAGTAVIDSCLFKGNGSDTITYGMGAYLSESATLVNCTVVNSYSTAGYPGAGVYVGSSTAKVVNTILYNNGGTAETEFGNVNLGRFFHCASTVENPDCATWRTMSKGDFLGVEANDFRLSVGSQLVDGGSMDGEWYPADATALDLDGKSRKSGDEIDFGCYEVDLSGVACSGAMSFYSGFEGSNITLTASAKGGTGGPYRFRWDCGNGVTNETADAVSTYAWQDSGLYVIKVSASDDGGESWSAWATLPVKLVIAPKTVYVSVTSATPTYPYRTPETAAKKVSGVLAAFTNNVSAGLCAVDGLTVRVLPGGVVDDFGITLAAAVEIVGETENPQDVTIRNNTAGQRAFNIQHAGAVVRDLTVSGTGFKTSYSNGTASYGGHVHMTAGTVENCIITGGNAAAGGSGGWGRGLGGNVYMTGGRLVRCQILNGISVGFKQSSDVENRRSYGAGVYAAGTAVIDSCLFKGNGSDTITYGMGAYLSGSATLVNCTVVNSYSTAGYPGAGVYVGSDTAKVVNTILFNNGGTAETEFGNVNLGRFFHCASTVENPDCATWRTMSSGDFVSVSANDYHLVLSSPLVDGGSTDAEWYPADATPIDMDGMPRVSGDAIDIGCYEADQSKVSASGKVSNSGFEGSNVTLTASAKGGTGGPYRFRWDCGNGVTNETADVVSTYAWQDSGLYVIKVSASDDGGESWSAWATLPVKLVIAPKTVYVSATSANPTYPYKTPETAAKKISTALAAFTNNVSSGLCAVDGLTIRVLAGTVDDTGMTLAAAVEIVGDTGDPNDVSINDNVSGSRAFLIQHEGAVVRDLTIKGTGIYKYSSGHGGHVNMTAGTVENCIVTGGYGGAASAGGHNKSYGGNVYMTGGRLVRCQVLNGNTSSGGSNQEDSWGGGIYALGTAVVENCLIKGNGLMKPGRAYGGGICVDGSARVVNCTIVGNAVNVNAKGGGVYVRSSTAKVVNCVVFDNGGTPEMEFGDTNLSCYDHCASSVDNESCATWQVIDETAFRNWSRREEGLKFLMPKSGKPLCGTGTDAEGYAAAGGTSSVDLLGKNRQFGKRLDIGCLESQAGGMMLFVR